MTEDLPYYITTPLGEKGKQKNWENDFQNKKELSSPDELAKGLYCIAQLLSPHGYTSSTPRDSIKLQLVSDGLE